MPKFCAATVARYRHVWISSGVALGLVLSLVLSSCWNGAHPRSKRAQPAPLAQKERARPVIESPAFLHRPDTRAMWLWNETPGSRAIVENRSGAQDKLLRFLRAPHQKPERAINRLYFAARAHTQTDPLKAPYTLQYNPLSDPRQRSDLQRLLRRLNDQGIATELLAGQAIWLASDDYAKIPVGICRDTVAFNLSSDNPNARFSGVHLDIEPHTVTRGPWAKIWFKKRLPNGYNAAWTRRWKQILTSCRQILDAYKAKTGQKLTLSSDLGTDFAHYNKPMYDFINRHDGPLDYLVVLNYFDSHKNARGQTAFFYGALADEQPVGGVRQNLASWTQIPVVVGVETGPETIARDSASFHQEGYQNMYQTLDKLLADYASPRLIGVAIHHYSPDAYRDMKP